MSSRNENKLMKQTIARIAKRYNTAYAKIIKDIPSLIKTFYGETKGWEEVQALLNQALKPVNEFSQVNDYNTFYQRAYNDVIRLNKKLYGFQYNFSQVDQRALETFRSPQNWFVSKYQTLTDQSRTLFEMEDLWKSGESVEVSAKSLNNIFGRSNARINAHTKTTIITNNTKVRTNADLNNFHQNGITRYIYKAVLDNVTTDLCEDLDGKIYTIKTALDFQNKVNNDVNKIIQDGQRNNTADWKTYNSTVKYLQKNDALSNRTGTGKKPWQSTTILRTKDPQKQGKTTTKSYKSFASVPGNQIPRPGSTHFNCRSRIKPII